MWGLCWIWRAALWLSLNPQPTSGEVPPASWAPWLGEEAPFSPVFLPLGGGVCALPLKGASPPSYRHLTQGPTPSPGNASLTASVFVGVVESWSLPRW